MKNKNKHLLYLAEGMNIYKININMNIKIKINEK